MIVPQGEGLQTEGRRHGIRERKEFRSSAPEPEAAPEPDIGVIHRLEGRDPCSLLAGRAFIQCHYAKMVRDQPDAQQLRIHVGALEYRRDLPQQPGHTPDASFEILAFGGDGGKGHFDVEGSGGVYQSENSLARIANHILGGARFGNDASDSVLDRNCRAWHFDNLYVTDGAFMPTSGSGNPTLTIQANAFRVADVMLRNNV